MTVAAALAATLAARAAALAQDTIRAEPTGLSTETQASGGMALQKPSASAKSECQQAPARDKLETHRVSYYQSRKDGRASGEGPATDVME